MHSIGLKTSDLSARVGDRPIAIDALFPDFDRSDRFGIVVRESLGMLGASLLIQAFIASYYDHRRKTGTVVPHYPEVYAFHIGGRYGDLRMLDFEPIRKEVFVETAAEAMAAVNQCGITRLAIPEADPSPKSLRWEEVGAANDRIRSGFFYSPVGRVSDPEFTIAGKGDMILDNVKCVSDVQHTLDTFAHLEKDPVYWSGTLDARRGEIDPGTRACVDERLREAGSTGRLVESFRGADVEALIARI